MPRFMHACRRFTLAFFSSMIYCAALAAPPPAEVQPVTDTIHGVKLTDPYRWLEDQKSSQTRSWINAQIAYTRAALDAQPGRAELSERLTALRRIDQLGAPARRGDRYFLSRRLASQDQSVICLREGAQGEIQTLIDPHPLSPDHNVSVSMLDVSEDGKLLVYGQRKGGEDEIEVHLFDIDRRAELPCTLPRGRYNEVALTGDNSGLYYSRRDGQQAGRVYYAPLAAGQTPRETCLFGTEYGPEQHVNGSLSEDHRHLMIDVSWGWGKRTDIFVRDLTREATIRPIISGIDASFSGEIIGDTLYVQTNWQAPKGRILAIDLKNPAVEAWREVIPERSDTVIESFTLAGGRLFLHVSRNVLSRVELYTLESGRAKAAGQITFADLGTVSAVGGRWRDEDVYFSFTSYHIPPTLYQYNIPRAERTVYWRSSVPFDSAPYQTRQVWYQSQDGTRVPMFVVARKGLKLDGNSPALLYGYGGFNLGEQPAFSTNAALWIERGGVYAVACLRGGNEFGEDWHRDGMLSRKQNVFDDFIAAAQYLVDRHYTNPERLAIMGGSNGGLLVGAALTQRPDLFRAAICGVPLLDMIRFHKFLLGPLWVSEYGSAEDPQQFKTLLAYSPYHHVQAGTRYPAVMFMTGDSDTRVAPLHARKMTALLQAAASGQAERPVLLRYETSAGHSAGQSLVKTIESDVDRMGFLFWQLGMNKEVTKKEAQK